MSFKTAIWPCLFAGCFLTMAAAAQDASPVGSGANSNLILLIEQTKGGVTGFEDIGRALEAHLGASAIEVRERGVGSLPSDQSNQEKKARALAIEEAAGAVMWIDVRKQTMFLIFKEIKGDEQTLSRYFDCISKNLVECADPIASAVSSALSSWIGRSAQHQLQYEPVMIKPVIDNDLDPIALEQAPWNRPVFFFDFLFDAGYVLARFDSEKYSQGAHLGFRMIWLRYLSLDVSVDVLSRVT